MNTLKIFLVTVVLGAGFYYAGHCGGYARGFTKGVNVGYHAGVGKAINTLLPFVDSIADEAYMNGQKDHQHGIVRLPSTRPSQSVKPASPQTSDDHNNGDHTT